MLPPSLTTPRGSLATALHLSRGGQAEDRDYVKGRLSIANTLSPGSRAWMAGQDRYVDPVFMRNVDTAPILHEDRPPEEVSYPIRFAEGGEADDNDPGNDVSANGGYGNDLGGYAQSVADSFNNSGISNYADRNYSGYDNGNGGSMSANDIAGNYESMYGFNPDLIDKPLYSPPAAAAPVAADAPVAAPPTASDPTGDIYGSSPGASAAAAASEPSFSFDAPAPSITNPHSMDPSTVPGYEAPSVSFGASASNFNPAAGLGELAGAMPATAYGSGLTMEKQDPAKEASNVGFSTDPSLPSFARDMQAPDIVGTVDPNARSLFAESPTLTATGVPYDANALGLLDRTNLPAGMRNYNPGNLKYSGSDWQSKNFSGMKGPSVNTDQGDPQINFDNDLNGMAAAARLAQAKYSQGMTTVNDLITKQGVGWTPGNYSAAKNIAASMGVAPNAEVDLTDPQQMRGFLKGVVKQEQGPDATNYPAGLYDAAVDKTLGSHLAASGVPAMSNLSYNVDPMDVAMAGQVPSMAQTQVAGPAMAAPSYFNDNTLASAYPASFSQPHSYGEVSNPTGSFASAQDNAVAAGMAGYDGGFHVGSPVSMSYGSIASDQPAGLPASTPGFRSSAEDQMPAELAAGPYSFSGMQPSSALTRELNARGQQYADAPPSAYSSYGQIASDQPAGMPGYGTIASDQPAGVPSYGRIASDQPAGMPVDAILSGLPYSSTPAPTPAAEDDPPGTVHTLPNGMTYKTPMDPREAFLKSQPTEDVPSEPMDITVPAPLEKKPSTEMVAQKLSPEEEAANEKGLKVVKGVASKGIDLAASAAFPPYGIYTAGAGISNALLGTHLPTLGSLISDYGAAHPGSYTDIQGSQGDADKANFNSGTNGYMPTAATAAGYLPASSTVVAPASTPKPASATTSFSPDKTRSYLGAPTDLLHYGFRPETKMFASTGGYLPASKFG